MENKYIKKRTSVFLFTELVNKLREKNINISGTVSDLLDKFIKNDFSMDFGNNEKKESPNTIELLRKFNFLKKMCRILDEINTELKNDKYKSNSEFKSYMEILVRHGLKQDEYAQMKELINLV